MEFGRLAPIFPELRRLMEETRRQQGASVRFFPFIYKGSLEKFLDRLNRGRVSISVISAGAEVRFLRVTLRSRIAKDHDTQISGDFILFPFEAGIWCFVSPEKSAVFGKIVPAMMQATSAIASSIFVANRDYKRIFDGLIGQGYSAQVHLHSQYNRQESSTTSLREKRDFRLVYNEIMSKDSAIRRIRTAIRKDGSDFFALFSLGNNGTVSFKQGDIGFVLSAILPKLAELGLAKDELFSNRARQKSVLHPLSFLFEQEVLADKLQNKELLAALSSIKKSALTVFHSNPYVHCLFTDFRDGSSFNLYSSSSSSLEVVPSVRSSVSSLMRLYKGVSEKFADCEVALPVTSEPTPAEFFGG